MPPRHRLEACATRLGVGRRAGLGTRLVVSGWAGTMGPSRGKGGTCGFEQVQWDHDAQPGRPWPLDRTASQRAGSLDDHRAIDALPPSSGPNWSPSASSASTSRRLPKACWRVRLRRSISPAFAPTKGGGFSARSITSIPAAPTAASAATSPADRWHAIPFAAPMPLDVRTLSKLARAADPEVSSLNVYADADGELFIWAMVDQEPRHGDRITLETDVAGQRPGLFQAAITGTGDLTVYHNAVLLETSRKTFWWRRITTCSGPDRCTSCSRRPPPRLRERARPRAWLPSAARPTAADRVRVAPAVAELDLADPRERPSLPARRRPDDRAARRPGPSPCEVLHPLRPPDRRGRGTGPCIFSAFRRRPRFSR